MSHRKLYSNEFELYKYLFIRVYFGNRNFRGDLVTIGSRSLKISRDLQPRMYIKIIAYITNFNKIDFKMEMEKVPGLFFSTHIQNFSL